MKHRISFHPGLWALTLIAAALLVLAGSSCYGQATTGQIAGQVLDPTGAVVAGAAITVTDEQKGVTFAGHTDATGNYVVLNLPPGSYSVTAVAPGFSEQKMTHVVLAIDQHAELNLSLQVGTAASSVVVTEAPPILQTQSSELGTVIGGAAITDLPLYGRNFYALTSLVPGVNTGNAAPASSVPQFSTVLYGATYYSEYEPYDRLDQDVAMTKAAHLNVVRMGESTWSLWGPRDGQFDYAWMDRVVDAMGKAGIKVILGTPTYSIPAWMAREHPEILAITLSHAPYGGPPTPGVYGMRQNMDTDSPIYRFYAERLIRHIVAHYKNNPTVIGWQLDNETGSYDADNPDVFGDLLEGHPLARLRAQPRLRRSQPHRA